MRRKKENHIKIRMVSKILWGISLLVILFLLFLIISADVLPFKYFLPIVLFFVLSSLIHATIVWPSHIKVGILIFVNILAVLFILVGGFASLKINDVLVFLHSNLGVEYENYVYNVVVNKNSPYNVIRDLDGMTIDIYKDIDDIKEVENKLLNKINVEFAYKDSVNNLFEEIIKDETKAIVVSSGNYDVMTQIDEEFEKNVKVLYTFSIQKKVENQDVDIDVTKEPFVIYLGGIDTRSDSLPSRSLTDVNIVLAVNPQTRDILMVHIPRDYFIDVPNVKGEKDKLTHMGINGGVDLSMQAIENLLEIDISFYTRVNFNAVINLVDAIGGINIYSDVDYSFKCWTDSSCVFKPGYNYVGGKCALAFARERHAYITGDRHRGENQEQVIELIIDKVTSSKTLISNYSDILKALDGTFESNLSTADITSLVKMQLNNMASWNIETYNVNGSDLYDYTYSFPNRKMYVMEPDMDTVNEAINKLNKVLDN